MTEEKPTKSEGSPPSNDTPPDGRSQTAATPKSPDQPIGGRRAGSGHRGQGGSGSRGTKELGGSSDATKNSQTPAPSAPEAGKAAEAAGTADKLADGAAGTAANHATRKALGGKSENPARKNLAKYGGAAAGGAVGGARAGVPGAAAGAAKGVAVQGGKDAVLGGAKKAPGNGKDKDPSGEEKDAKGKGKPSQDELGAGGTGRRRSSSQDEDEESSGKKVAKRAAVGGAAVAAPPAAAMITLMALLRWLKMLFMQMAAAAANFFSAALAWVMGVGKAALNVAAAPFMWAGSAISTGLAAVIGISLAPVAAASSAAVGFLAVLAMLGGVLVSAVTGSPDPGRPSSSMGCIAPAGGYTGGPIDATEAAHAEAVYSILKAKGMPDENIAGILGNWSQESGVDPTSVEGIFDEPYKVGPRKTAKVSGGSNFGIGLGQWTADRNTLLKNYANTQGADWWDLELQLDFMFDPAGDNPSDVKILEKMVTTSMGSPREAAIYFEEKWERAGVPAMENRITAAERWYDEMQNWDGSGPSGSEVDTEPVSNDDSGRENTTLNLGPVKPHVQEAAEMLYARFPGVTTVGGYREGSSRDPNGHPMGLAIDMMVPLNSDGKKTGDELAAYAVAHADELNVQYVIWYQQIWNADRADEGWRDMEDRGSDTQNHKDHPHISFKTSGDMQDVAPPSIDGCSNGTGVGGGGSGELTDGGLDMQQAEAFMAEYNSTGDAFLREKYNGGGPGQCNGDYVRNCVSFSVYFLNKYTSFTDYPMGNGKDTAGATARMTGKSTSGTPSVYSVFSHGNSSAAGHTGIVLGIDGDRLLIGEAAYCGYEGRARWVEPGEWKDRGWSFVDVSDLVGESEELAA